METVSYNQKALGNQTLPQKAREGRRRLITPGALLALFLLSSCASGPQYYRCKQTIPLRNAKGQFNGEYLQVDCEKHKIED